LFSKYSSTLEKGNIDLYNKIYNTIVKKDISFKLIDKEGRSCLHYAAESGNMTMIKTLLAEGLDINKVDNKGDTAFSLMIKNSYHKLEDFIPIAV
jgi:ankyrin repeat protein